ncbi:amidohydrolase family protein [Lacrimispora sp. 38-1]|uniref:amidohydrolase family protein n=1 Tax=Lacrimispora sp. 38-1 TaxID=3125778 RepID=UPI003CEC6A17
MIIKNGTILSMAGIEEERKDILIKNGTIFSIKDHINPANEEDVIDAEGRIVMPGFVEPHTTMGVNNQVFRFDKMDANEESDPLMPQLRAIDAIDVEDEGFAMARRGGITSVVTGPGMSDLIGGTFCAFKTGGSSFSERIIREEVCYHFVLSSEPRKKYGSKKKSPETRMGSVALIREMLYKAQIYDKRIRAGEKLPYDIKSASLSRVFHGLLVKFSACQENDIRAAIRIGKEFNLKYTIDFGYDAMKLQEELKKEQIPVIIGPLLGKGYQAETQGKDLSMAKQLDKSGLNYCLMTGHPLVNGELTGAYLALLHKYGMSRREVLEGLTIRAAKLSGINDRVGSLEVNKDADIVIWNGDPLDYYASVHTMIINGRRVPI